jgi:asparaginyl-tRNA synthetase
MPKSAAANGLSTPVTKRLFPAPEARVHLGVRARAFAGAIGEEAERVALVEVVGRVVEQRRAELTVLERDVAPIARVAKPFPRVRYEDALDLLAADGKPLAFGDDFGGDEETVLSERFDRPVLVHRYPAACKAFYMKRDPADARLALCVDVLAPEGYGEIIGGGQREDDLSRLEARVAEHALPPEPIDWYLDLRRFGSVPHAGFGMGVERCVAWICGLHHVRETIPFARMMERITP